MLCSLAPWMRHSLLLSGRTFPIPGGKHLPSIISSVCFMVGWRAKSCFARSSCSAWGALCGYAAVVLRFLQFRGTREARWREERANAVRCGTRRGHVALRSLAACPMIGSPCEALLILPRFAEAESLQLASGLGSLPMLKDGWHLSLLPWVSGKTLNACSSTVRIAKEFLGTTWDS